MPGGAMPGGAMPGGAMPGGAMPGGQMTGGAMPGGQMTGGAMPGGEMTGGAMPGGEMTGGSMPGGAMAGGEMGTGGAPAWTSCMLDAPPDGACFGPDGVFCDPDRLMNAEAFAYAPADVPAVPDHPIRVHWHIFLRADESGDVTDEILAQNLVALSTAFEEAGISFTTAGIHRHAIPGLSMCSPMINLSVVVDPMLSFCQEGTPSQVAVDPTRFLNVYVLDLMNLGGFAPLPCVMPPTDPRHGVYMDRAYIADPTGPTLVHELGHYLGLLHVFHNWNWANPAADSVCSDEDNDFVADTPPQRKSIDYLPDLDCEAAPSTCLDAAQPDSVFNFMQYTPCGDVNSGRFTTEQLRRMQWTLGRARSGLLAQ